MKLQKAEIIYIVSLAILTVFMIWNIFFSFIAFDITFLIFYMVAKFLSGFGLVLNISSGFLMLFDKA